MAMSFFRVLWSIDVVAAAVAVAFFLIGIADGTVSSFNIVLWVALLGGLAVIVFGSRALEQRQKRGAAIALAGVLAVPSLLFAAMIAVFALSGARWN
jgi:hypothetical protein